MIHPTLDEFKKQAGTATLIPVYTEVMADLETPVSAFMKLSHNGYAYLLESVEGGTGRFSFLGVEPETVVSVSGSEVTVRHKDAPEERFESAEPLKHLLSMISAHRLPETNDPPPFCGGAVGYLSYDCVRRFEAIPDRNPDPLAAPEALFMFANRYLIFDRLTHRLRLVVNARIESTPEEAYRRAAASLEELASTLRQPAPAAGPEEGAARTASPATTASLSEEAFVSRVEKCLDYIRSGDILQAVLSIRHRFPLDVDPFSVYRALRVLNPSPYMFYLKMGDLHLIGSSPELMVKVEGSRVAMNPIAGTRPRGRSRSEDLANEKDLLDDAKEAAEHLMLVDLARNDLGRVSQPGSVTVPSFRRVERFSHVMHLVSTVEGELCDPADLMSVLRAVFPAGTVSGAPKIRAMEIIDELEPERRGPYAGLVGYFDYRGNMDSCITIRTIVVRGNEAFIQTGAGIVADSRPEREYQECRHKAEALFRAVALARGGEL